MDLSRYAELFRAETREHLGALNQLLLDWERSPEQIEPVHGIFRSVHTIKGMAATMGYAPVADLAHRAENLLDVFRREEQTVTPEIIELLFRTADALEELVEAAATGTAAGEDVAPLLEALDEASWALEPEEQRDRPRRRISFVSAPSGAGHKVQVVIRADSPLKGARALVALRRVEALGTVRAVEPGPAAIEREEFDGRFAFRLETTADRETIEHEIRAAGDIDRVAVDADEDVAATAGRDAPGRTRHIRVSLRRLDRLMNLAGELVTARGRLEHLSSRLDDPLLTDAVEKVSHLTVDLQSEILQARMTPVWQVFDRFPRLVRDLSRQLGKEVEFRVEGKEIEVDRAILDELSDPLVHLLRNAVDHGVEKPEDREAAGKPRTGQIVLAALRERSTIAIVVHDDGRGIDRDKILAEARRMGAVDEATENLSDDQLFRVLARSGFSLAREVSDVSGRGVGVDVVATRMRALGGSVEIKSQPGAGTTFALRVPVTLAIVRALLARIGEEQYALPLTHVTETVELTADRVADFEGRKALRLREETVPLIDLREVIGVGGVAPPKRPVVVVGVGDRRAGVVVDSLLGQQEIVVKPFDAPQGTLPIFGGATILGDGSPVLILDAAGLV